MRLLAIGDLHIKMVPGVPKDWQIKRYEEYIDNLISECKEKPTILAIVGDTLDSITPSKEELRLFLSLLHKLKNEDIHVLLVSGNHCTIQEGSSILDYLLLDEFPNICYRRNLVFNNTTFHLVNHDSLKSYAPSNFTERNILLSHFRCTIPPHITEEINVKKLTKPFDLCIVGDIHTNLQFDNVYYTNQPLNKQFETEPSCSYLEVDLDTLKVTRKPAFYPSLIAKKMIAKKFHKEKFPAPHFYKVEVEGTPEELRLIKEAHSNVKLCRIPLLEKSVALSEEVTEAPVLSLDDDLVDYMKALGYKDQLIADMLTELRGGYASRV